jgi:hypothetical protein
MAKHATATTTSLFVFTWYLRNNAAYYPPKAFRRRRIIQALTGIRICARKIVGLLTIVPYCQHSDIV